MANQQTKSNSDAIPPRENNNTATKLIEKHSLELENPQEIKLKKKKKGKNHDSEN